MDTYKTIATTSQGIYKDKGSRFISFAYPVSSESEINDIVRHLKKEYHDARHHCYAWRIDPCDEKFRANDDGEPSSSAGRPILGQLLSRELTNLLVVVVRYFGGIKLGVPGLIQAYKAAAADALDNNSVVEKTIDAVFRITFPYTEMNGVMKTVKELQPEILSQAFDNLCTMELSIRKSREQQLADRLSDVEGAVVTFIAYR